MSNETSIKKQPNKIYKLDCNTYLDEIDEKIIDCIILDPPYFNVVNEKWDKLWKSLDKTNSIHFWGELPFAGNYIWNFDIFI